MTKKEQNKLTEICESQKPLTSDVSKLGQWIYNNASKGFDNCSDELVNMLSRSIGDGEVYVKNGITYSRLYSKAKGKEYITIRFTGYLKLERESKED
jgi:hypothetical protein